MSETPIPRWKSAAIAGEHLQTGADGWWVRFEDHVAAVAAAREDEREKEWLLRDFDSVRADAIKAARDAVEALDRYAMPEDWLVGVDRKVVLAAIDALTPTQQHKNEDHDQQDRVDDEQNVVSHAPESQDEQ